jgi:transposase
MGVLKTLAAASQIGMRRPVPQKRAPSARMGTKLGALKGARRNRPMSKNSMLFVGVDLGDKFSHVTVLDQEGDLAEEARLPTIMEAFERKFSVLPRSRVAMEVGGHSRWASKLVENLDHEVLVANARKLRAIYENPRKDDKADAETLAHLARLDPRLPPDRDLRLSPIRHRSPEAQADLTVIRSRDALVRSRTLLIDHARSTVKASGARLPSCSADSFHRKVRDVVPEPLRPALLPVIDIVASLTEQIRAYDRKVEELSQERYPEKRLLRDIGGVGPLTSLAYVLTLEDPSRFHKSREVAPALGLVPGRGQSGDQDPQRHVTTPSRCFFGETGDVLLLRLLVDSAHYILGPFGPDCDLRRWGLKLAARGGKNAKKRAAVAVARKLAILMHHLWETGEAYDPLRQSHDQVALRYRSGSSTEPVPAASVGCMGKRGRARRQELRRKDL